MTVWMLLTFLMVTLNGCVTAVECPTGCLCSPLDHQGGMVVNCISSSQPVLLLNYPPTTVGLYLDKNNLKTLEGVTFSDLPHLHNLSIADNLLELVPLNILVSIVAELMLLDLSNNWLSAIPEGIPASLKVLNLSFNKIGTFDMNTLQHLNSLEELKLNDNNIADITCSTFKENSYNCTSGYKQLRKLDLSNNRINHISTEALHPFSNLKALTLAGNKLTSLEIGTFFNFDNLQFLDLRNNQLRKITDSTFKKLDSLKYLYLKGNFLKEVPRDLPMLDWLDISWNQISHISEADSKKDLFPIEVLVLSHNPLHCDCHLLWLKELQDRREYMLNYINIPAVDFVPSCLTPPNLAGESWDLLADDTFICPDENLDYERHLNTPYAKNAMFDETSDKKDMTYVHHDIKVKLEATEITSDFIMVRWKIKGRPHRDTLFIQYYQFGEQESTTLFSQVIATKSHHTLGNLLPDTHYVVCAFPKREDNELGPSNVDQCIHVWTLAISSWWEDYLPFSPIQESVWFQLKLFSISLLLMCIIVWTGLYILDWISYKKHPCEHHKND